MSIDPESAVVHINGTTRFKTVQPWERVFPAAMEIINSELVSDKHAFGYGQLITALDKQGFALPLSSESRYNLARYVLDYYTPGERHGRFQRREIGAADKPYLSATGFDAAFAYVTTQDELVKELEECGKVGVLLNRFTDERIIPLLESLEMRVSQAQAKLVREMFSYRIDEWRRLNTAQKVAATLEATKEEGARQALEALKERRKGAMWGAPALGFTTGRSPGSTVPGGLRRGQPVRRGGIGRKAPK